MPCSDPLSLSTSHLLPSPKYYVSMPKSEKKKKSMFSDGKVVENAFRLNIPSDPRMVDIHLFVCITLVIKKKKKAKITQFLCLTSTPPTHSHFLPIFNSTVKLSNMLVQHLCKNNMKIDHISQSVDFESRGGGGMGEGRNPPFILHFRLFISLQISSISTQLQVWLKQF